MDMVQPSTHEASNQRCFRENCHFSRSVQSANLLTMHIYGGFA